MIDSKEIVNEIQLNLDSFSDSIEPLQRKLYNKVVAILKDLSLDAEGNIKQTSANVDVINKINVELQSIVKNPVYQKSVAGIKPILDDIKGLQDNYFNKIDDNVNPPAVADSIKNQAFDSAVTSLTEAGINENVVNAASDIVSTGITEGTSFADMNDQLKTFIVGNDKVDGKLLSYSKQIVSDTLHGASRNYNNIMTDKLGLVWFQYVGALVADSRPLCIALDRKRWIHVSELPSICQGIVDGQQVSRAGMMPDTNKENFVSRCGGYNCEHHCVPVPSESVPNNIRKKFEKDVNLSDEEIADDRPRRK